MSKHTAGPWHVDGAKPHQIVLHTEKTNLLRIASVNTQFTGTYEANARLIAAAPDLLAAAKQAAALIRNGGVVPIAGEAWKALDDAIHKAERP